MQRRSVIALAGALVLAGRKVALAQAVFADSAMLRVARSARRELDARTLDELLEIGENARRLEPDSVGEAIAADFRSGRTVVLRGVMFSEHEVALALSYARQGREVH